jgi:hypothetical protein
MQYFHIRIFSFLLLILVCAVPFTYTAAEVGESYEHEVLYEVGEVLENAKVYQNVHVPQIATTSVVSFRTEYDHTGFVLLETTAIPPVVQPYMFVSELQRSVPEVVSPTALDNPKALVDDDIYTGATYDVLSGSRTLQVAEITLRYQELFTADELQMVLGKFIAAPVFVEIVADGERIFAQNPGGMPTISFPQTSAKEWVLKMTHIQPLRLMEVQLGLAQHDALYRQGMLYFHAEPEKQYRLYRELNYPVDSVSDKEVVVVSAETEIYEGELLSVVKNPEYNAPDIDTDGILDFIDNCVRTENRDQIDSNNDGLGDACEDDDNDGLIAARDNCPDIANKNQIDSNNDGVGDACGKKITIPIWVFMLGSIAGLMVIIGGVLILHRRR